MFFEKGHHIEPRTGSIEVICGSMFSGKTEELIRRINRAKIAKLKVEVFKAEMDKRYNDDEVVSHDQSRLESQAVQNALQILLYTAQADVIAIDEAQFFGDELVDVCNELAKRGIRVIIAGLDMDFQGQPFGPIPKLLAVADYITKLHAICMGCGGLALYSHRLVEGNKLVMIGEKDTYEPLCRNCYHKIET